ncbi:uncharacterized protein K444DRAFT_96950 [Hyaloscypha bicolor E]|uniref:Uncharacterized protein n=1 Tax=Hyaloscypha bicolor E TaxID=1095630 RepID=A0A2J6SWD6_9HELO|nr:uncharacterized protein K444DRAFT_96950 [Hyaloscypha bicolor E]PMD55078.1 hypothetical protein K444DRAFT_96950 [Hyaloscypha bicolor E]
MNGKTARVFLSIADTQCRPSRLSRYNTGWVSCAPIIVIGLTIFLPPACLLQAGVSTPALCDCRPAKAYRISYRLRYPAVGLFFPCLATPPIGSEKGSSPTGPRPNSQCKKSLTTWSLEGALPHGIGLPDPACVFLHGNNWI